MATDTRSLPANITATADFRAWGGGISAQLTAIGLVKAGDSGQIDWTTVNAPSSGSFAGYEIWRFNDTLQSTKPVFIKLEYGVINTSAPSLRIQVSTATNGAGTPSGQLGTQQSFNASTKTAGITLASYCSGSASRLNLCNNLDPASASYHMQFYVERTKTAAGTDTGDGIATLIAGGGSGSVSWQLIPFVGAIPGTQSRNPALDLASGGLTVSGSDVLLAPTVCFYGRALFASWCVYRYADPGISETVPITVDHFGSTHTYMPLGDGTTLSGYVLPFVAGYATATLWE